MGLPRGSGLNANDILIWDVRLGKHYRHSYLQTNGGFRRSCLSRAASARRSPRSRTRLARQVWTVDRKNPDVEVGASGAIASVQSALPTMPSNLVGPNTRVIDAKAVASPGSTPESRAPLKLRPQAGAGLSQGFEDERSSASDCGEFGRRKLPRDALIGGDCGPTTAPSRSSWPTGRRCSTITPGFGRLPVALRRPLALANTRAPQARRGYPSDTPIPPAASSIGCRAAMSRSASCDNAMGLVSHLNSLALRCESPRRSGLFW